MKLKIAYGFTLSEILITLVVAGVITAITLPALITNIKNRIYTARQENISQKVSKAMYNMKALGLLNTTYPTTDAFVNELEKHLKIAKRCNADNIADCWPTNKVIRSDGQIYEVKEAKTGKDLHVYTNNTNNVGLVLADGASIILTYNENSKGADVGDKNDDATDLIDFVMDVNGAKGPNRENTGSGNYDIRSFRTANFGGCTGRIDGYGCIVYLGTNYDCISEGDYQDNDNCWAGARDACKAIDMKLATYGQTLLNDYAKFKNIGLNGSYWVSGGIVYNSNRDGGSGGFYNRDIKFNTFCVE